MTSLVQVKYVKKILVSLVYVGKERESRKSTGIVDLICRRRKRDHFGRSATKWPEFSLTTTKIKECSFFSSFN